MLIFRRLGVSTLVIIYLLILAGGIVRSTGSGMGCPDWPKCFGEWIPPTQASELPANYKEIYAEQRKAKNERLANMLERGGFKELSQKIKGDSSMYEEADFNVYKTWIEYVNRLLGVLTGFLILLTLMSSVAYWNKDRVIVYGSVFSLVLVGFQGWIGSIVVSTNLLPGMITTHMLLAILLVFCLIYLVYRSRAPQVENIGSKKLINTLLGLGIVLLLIQLILGTQVRESVDIIAKALGEAARNTWISQLGIEFYVHRSFSLLVLAVHGILVYKLMQQKGLIYKNALLLLALLIIETASGAAMAYMAIPAFIQPLHLLLAVVGLGIQFYVLLLVNQRQTIQNLVWQTENNTLKADDYNQVSY